MDWPNTTARQDENNLNIQVFAFCVAYIRDFTVLRDN